MADPQNSNLKQVYTQAVNAPPPPDQAPPMPAYEPPKQQMPADNWQTHAMNLIKTYGPAAAGIGAGTLATGGAFLPAIPAAALGGSLGGLADFLSGKLSGGKIGGALAKTDPGMAAMTPPPPPTDLPPPPPMTQAEIDEQYMRELGPPPSAGASAAEEAAFSLREKTLGQKFGYTPSAVSATLPSASPPPPSAYPAPGSSYNRP